MLSSIGAALKLIYEIVQGAKLLAAFIQENKKEQWFQDSAATWARVKEAKTNEEKKAVVRDIATLWSRM